MKGVKTLHSYQKNAVEKIRKIRSLIAWWPTGSGKTLLAVVATKCYLADVPRGVVIFLSNKTLQDNYIKELKSENMPMDLVVKVKKVDGKFPVLRKLGSGRIRVLLVQYTSTFVDFVRAWGKLGSKQPPFEIIMDEAHNARNLDGKSDSPRIKSLMKMTNGSSKIKKAEKVILLSGTPIYNTPYDIVPLLAMAHGEKPISPEKFAQIMKDPKKLKNYIGGAISIYDKPRDPKDYPSSKEHIVNIEMPPAYYKLYREKEQAISHDAFNSKIRQLSNIQIEGVENPKVTWTVNKIVQDLKRNPNAKTIVYSAFIVNGINQIKTKLVKNKIQFVEIQGQVLTEDRTKAVKEFNEGKKKVIFITKAGGEGLDLKGVRNVVHLESDWTRSGEEQVFGRAVRYHSHVHLPPSERHVDIYHLVLKKPGGTPKGKDTADVILCSLKEKKREELEHFKNMIKSL